MQQQQRGRSQKKEISKRSNTEDVRDKRNSREQKQQNSAGRFPPLQIQSRSVYVGYGNNAKLIQKYFQNLGWRVLDLETDKFSTNFNFKWVQTVNDIMFGQLKEGQQIVNHIPNITIIASKSKLIQTVREYESRNKNLPFNSKEFFPETYRIDLTNESISLEEDNFMKRSNDSIWIVKPVFANCGIGIKMCTNPKKIKIEIIRLKQQASLVKQGKMYSSSFFHAGLKKCIIQRYIQNPLLLEGRKFDIRCYVLIACTKPLMAFFHHGYLRLSMTEFNLENVDDESKRFIHLTNAAVQKKHPDFAQQKESTIWSMEKFEVHILRFNLQKEYLMAKIQVSKEKINQLYLQMKRIFAHMMRCCDQKFENRYGIFELMGCDILLDDQLKPYLLEMNTNPALFTDTSTQLKVIPYVVQQALDIVMQLQENPRNIEQFLSNPLLLKLKTFELIHNSHTGYSFK